MSDLQAATYTPTGTWRRRTADALFTAYVNCHLRREEWRRDRLDPMARLLEMDSVDEAAAAKVRRLA